ncbi:hypothetical protein [Pseudomonas sp. PA15(2017)]|uniref:hypothetical protein n=1 Tax=Pseudomonas sp. PA15(2017) TaxID=1932111 RepID=UPI00117A7AD1|nr:hypothetical protein [Pseudomonas sp. PA15(2017)]
MDRLRQLLEHAFGQRATGYPLRKPWRLPWYRTHAASKRRLHVDQSSLLRQPSTEATECTADHTSAGSCCRGSPRVDLTVDLIHRAAGDHRTLTSSTSRYSLARSLGRRCRRSHHAGAARSAEAHPANSTAHQHLRQGLGDQAGDVPRVARIGTRHIRGAAVLPGLVDLGGTSLARRAVLITRLLRPLAWLEARGLAQAVSSLVDEALAGHGAGDDIRQASSHARDLLHTTFQVGTKVAEQGGVLFRLLAFVSNFEFVQ